MYMDVNSQHWQLLDQAITDRGHAVYHTLQQIYSRRHSAVSTLKHFLPHDAMLARYMLSSFVCLSVTSRCSSEYG